MTTKECRKCGVVKSVLEFSISKFTGDGLNSYCLVCRQQMSRAYRMKKGKKLWARLNKYGITQAEWEDILKKQAYLCAICSTNTSGKREWSLDHDHTTGVIRGILCGRCNTMIGFAKDSPVILRAAASYLELDRKNAKTVISEKKSSTQPDESQQKPEIPLRIWYSREADG